MTPEFSPPPSGLPPIPVTVAAVGHDMLRMSGRVCDGVRLHGFCTRRYLEQVALPTLEEGLKTASRRRSEFEVWGGGFLATGQNEEEVQKSLDWVRTRVGFYASTRTYWPVLAAHGWEDLGAKLHRMSKEGRWGEMAAEVPEDVVRSFAAVGTFQELGREVEKRFGGLVDAIGLEFPQGAPTGLVREFVRDIQRISSPFEGFRDHWDQD